MTNSFVLSIFKTVCYLCPRLNYLSWVLSTINSILIENVILYIAFIPYRKNILSFLPFIFLFHYFTRSVSTNSSEYHVQKIADRFVTSQIWMFPDFFPPNFCSLATSIRYSQWVHLCYKSFFCTLSQPLKTAFPPPFVCISRHNLQMFAYWR